MERSSSIAQKSSGGLLFAGALVGLVGNALHPHTASPDFGASLSGIAGNGAWVAIHLAVIVAILLIVAGLTGLMTDFRGTAGEQPATLGLGAAVMGGTIVTMSTAIDGFGMNAMALAAAGLSGGEAAAAVGTARAVKEVGFAMWTLGILVFFGAAFACFGVAILASGRFPKALGWAAVIGAAGSTLAGLTQLAANGEVQAAESLLLGSTLVLTLWALIVGALMWRGSRLVPFVGGSARADA